MSGWAVRFPAQPYRNGGLVSQKVDGGTATVTVKDGIICVEFKADERDSSSTP